MLGSYVMEVLGVSRQQAEGLLAKSKGQLDQAINSYYDEGAGAQVKREKGLLLLLLLLPSTPPPLPSRSTSC